jgi:hypothetical protein
VEGLSGLVELRDNLFMRKLGDLRSSEKLGEAVSIDRDAGGVFLGDIFEFAIVCTPGLTCQG